MQPFQPAESLFDSVQIAEGSEADLAFWAIVLDASESELLHAISLVGCSVDAVKRCLRQP